jgi:hypothetical protein
MQNPRVSVIIPSYNYGNFIEMAIESVLKQTIKDIELIIIDDASFDNTRDIVNRFSDPRIKYVRNQFNMGHVKAINKGLKIAKGYYISIIGADDIMMPENLELKVNALENNPTAGLCFSNAIIIDQKGNEQGYFFKKANFSQSPYNYLKELLLKGNFIPASSVVTLRECYNKVGLYNENLKYAEDWDMWMRIAYHYDFIYIDQPLVKYRVHKDNLTKRIYKTWDDVYSIREVISMLYSSYNIEEKLGLSKDKILNLHIIRILNNKFGAWRLIEIISLYFKIINNLPILFFNLISLKILLKIIISAVATTNGFLLIHKTIKKIKEHFKKI